MGKASFGGKAAHFAYRHLPNLQQANVIITPAVAGPAPLPRPLRLSKKPNPPRWLDRDGERVIRKVVAGIGFEPMTFRL